MLCYTCVDGCWKNLSQWLNTVAYKCPAPTSLQFVTEHSLCMLWEQFLNLPHSQDNQKASIIILSLDVFSNTSSSMDRCHQLEKDPVTDVDSLLRVSQHLNPCIFILHRKRRRACLLSHAPFLSLSLWQPSTYQNIIQNFINDKNNC